TRSKRDWSSDVCSSDLDGSQEAGMAVPIFAGGAVAVHRLRRPLPGTAAAGKGGPHRGAGGAARGEELPMKKSVIRWPDRTRLDRSEERRVGNVGGSGEE